MFFFSVCRRWKLVGQLAWQDTRKYIDHLYNNYSLSKQLNIEKIVNRCGHHLTDLILSKNCDSSIVTIIAENCHNLVRLELKFKTINENNFTSVFSRMAKLKTIKIEDNRDRFNTNDKYYTHILDSIPGGIEEIFFHSACNVLQISHDFSSVSFICAYNKKHHYLYTFFSNRLLNISIQYVQ